MASPKCAHNVLATLLLSYRVISATFSVKCDHYVVYGELGFEKPTDGEITPVNSDANCAWRLRGRRRGQFSTENQTADFYQNENILTSIAKIGDPVS
jgi:hypothetical protein